MASARVCAKAASKSFVVPDRRDDAIRPEKLGIAIASRIANMTKVKINSTKVKPFCRTRVRICMGIIQHWMVVA